MAAAGPATGSAALPSGARVEVVIDPPRAGPTAIELRVRDASGATVGPVEVTATAALPDRGIPQQPLTLHRLGPGHYAAHGASLPYPGQWRITVTVRTSDVDAGVGSTTITLH